MSDARLKIVFVHEQFIVDVLNWATAPEGSPISLPENPNLPADAIVVAVHYEHCRRSFAVRLWSSEFEIVPPCGEIPLLEESPRFRSIQKPSQERIFSTDYQAISDRHAQIKESLDAAARKIFKARVPGETLKEDCAAKGHVYLKEHCGCRCGHVNDIDIALGRSTGG